MTPDPIGLSGGLNLYIYTFNNPVNNFDQFGLWDLISSYNALHSGYKPPSLKEMHYNRNQYNKKVTMDEAKDLGWSQMTPQMSKYHQIGTGNEDNLKFVSPDGHSEAVFYPDGTIVTDPSNMATYNYYSPYELYGIPHFFNDMLPYYIWRNSLEDPTTIQDLFTATFTKNCE